MRRWPTAVLVAALGIGTIGCAKAPPGQQTLPSDGAAVTAAPSTEPGRADEPAPVDPRRALGVPSGFSNDAGGAQKAAVAFTRFATELVAMADTGAIQARRAMAAEATAEDQAEEFVVRLAELRERWPAGTLSYDVRPLATRVEASGSAVVVDVWYVGLVAAPGIDTYAEWVTDTYELVWEAGDWRIASLQETPGPTPAPGPQEAASAAEIEARLVGFEALT